MISAQARLQARLGAGTRSFLHLLSDCDNADVTVVCSDGEVRVHSLFLRARSSYFRKLFHGMKTGFALPKIEQVSCKSVMAVVRFLLSDIVSFQTDDSVTLRELLFLAKTWRIHSLDVLFSRMAKNDAIDNSLQVRTIWEDLKDALDSNDPPTDCCLIVDQVRFKAHRLVLSQSGFFRSMLFGHFKESSSMFAEIPIGEFSPEQFAAVHSFFYNGALPKSSDLELVSSLIPLTHYLQWDDLRKGIEMFFQHLKDVDEYSLMETWKIASDSKTLQKVCVDFVVKYFDLIDLSIFFQLPEQLLIRALNTGELLLDEAVIFDRLIRWGYHNLNRPAPQKTSDINICLDAPLYKVLSPLLPPEVLLTKRNKKTLLGLDPFHISSLV